MNNLELVGKKEIQDLEFNHIEGGFGKEEMCILAKDIADMHWKELKEINQAINRNRGQFLDGVDIIDLKDTKFSVTLCDRDILSRSSIANANNIYLLSEKGYYKVVKILEDARSWKVYNVLLDSYFKMRATIKAQHNLTDDEILARGLRIAVERMENLKIENKVKDQKIAELQPKADYTDKILQCEGTMPVTIIAKDYGMSGEAFNKVLHNLGIQYKLKDTWLLYSPYQSKGYTYSKTNYYPNSMGALKAKAHTKWTQKGRLFLYQKLKENDIVPMIERPVEEQIEIEEVFQ